MTARARNTEVPHCRHFGVCGSCDRLDLGYALQLDQKERSLRERFAAFHPRCVRDLVVVPSPQIYRYRNKAIYPVRRSGDARVAAGFFRRGTHELVDIAECHVQERCLTRALSALRVAVGELGLAPYDERGGSGFVRALFARVATGTGELMLGVVTRGGEFRESAGLARRAEIASQGLETERGVPVRLAGFVRSIHDEPGNRLLGKRNVPLLGRDVLRERLGRLELELGIASFFQLNAGATIELYRRIERAIGAGEHARIVDAYAGIGSLALWIAPRARELWAIEVSRAAVRDARRNFVAAGRDADRVLEGRVEDRLHDVPDPIDVLVLDPPRSGLGPGVVAAVAARRPARVVYVSCNPVTLVRDAQPLLAAGYRLEPLEAVDLFPHTPHVEILATFVRDA